MECQIKSRTIKISQLTLTSLEHFQQQANHKLSRLENIYSDKFADYCHDMTKSIAVYQYQDAYYPLMNNALLHYLRDKDASRKVKVAVIQRFTQLESLKIALQNAHLFEQITSFADSQLSAFYALLSVELDLSENISQRSLAKVLGLDHSTLSKAYSKLMKKRPKNILFNFSAEKDALSDNTTHDLF